MISLQELEELYDAYVDTFRGGDGVLPPMMRLKREHTGHVVANARAIAAGEGFDGVTARVCEAAALLHDTGRYEQLRRYNTFRDSDSVDHAVFSRDIVVEKGWLDTCIGAGAQGSEDMPHSAADIRNAILVAVLVHNRRDVPDNLDPLTSAAVHTVRDADKLDIFRVLEHQISTTDWRHDCQAFWNLPVFAPPSPAVLDAIRADRPVDYQNIKTLADFVLIQVGWMICGLRYPTSRRLCAERGHLEFRRSFLHRLTDDPSVDELCAKADTFRT